jgi:hypothetical protein
MRRCRAVIAAAAVLAALAACEDEPTPDIPDPTPSSASPSPSESSPTSSPTPEVLTPEETVRAWVDARNQALQDGDTSHVRALTDPDCQACLGLITSIEEVYEAGGRYETKGWRIKSLRVSGSERPKVDTAMVIAGGTTINAAGEAPVTYPPDRRILVFRLHEDGEGFLVDFVGFLS